MFEIAVDCIIKNKPSFLGPFDEGIFPGTKLANHGSFKTNPSPLYFKLAIIGIKAVTAPVAIGVIGVRGKLN
jgi:hypothetical protein